MHKQLNVIIYLGLYLHHMQLCEAPMLIQALSFRQLNHVITNQRKSSDVHLLHPTLCKSMHARKLSFRVGVHRWLDTGEVSRVTECLVPAMKL